MCWKGWLRNPDAAAQGFCAALLLISASFARSAAGIPGDGNCDGTVDADDPPAVVAALFEPGPCMDADANGDRTRSAGDVTAELLAIDNRFAQEPAFDKVLDEIKPNGIIPLDTARRMFQLAYGGLDGVAVPPGPAGPSVDGTIALRGMLQHLDELSDADAARLDEVLNINGPVSVTIQPASPSSASPPIAGHPAGGHGADNPQPTPLPMDDANVQDFMERTVKWLPDIADKAQVLFTLPIDITGYAFKNPDAVADTIASDADGKVRGGGVPARCSIRFYQDFIDEEDAQRDNTVVHELWHCFEALIINNVDIVMIQESNWIIEGQAEYVGNFFAGTKSPFWEATAKLVGYLTTPAAPLFGRSYDAIGFYVTLEGNGTPMFAALKAMLIGGEGSNEAAFDAAQLRASRLLDTWGEMEFEAPLFPGDWNYLPSASAQGSSAPTGQPPAPDGAGIPGTVHLEMDDDSCAPARVPPYSVFLWDLNLATDFIHFQINGKARVLDESGREYDDLSDIWLCQHPDPATQCKCPDGSAGQAPPSQPIAGPLKLAASADGTGVSGMITSLSLDKLCRLEQPPATCPDLFCADARRLQKDDIDQYALAPLTSQRLQAEGEANDYWLGLMAQDAPTAIASAMQALAAAYVTFNSDFASIDYRIFPESQQDLQAMHDAFAAIGAVQSQAQQVQAYITQECGFALQLSNSAASALR